jgi:hypothetical protein
MKPPTAAGERAIIGCKEVLMPTSSMGQSNTSEQPRFEVADVLDRYFDNYRASHGVSRQQLKVVGAIRKCRTAALGAHVRKCDHCGHLEIAY